MIAGLNPWMTMWNRPRSTIRVLAYNRPTYGVFYLAVIYALQAFFFYANWWSLGIRVNYPLYLTVGIIGSPVMGMLWLYLVGEFFYFSGRLLNGSATRRQIRAAVAWSALPFTITLSMWFVLLFCSPEFAFIQYSGPYSSVFIVLITLIAKIWSFVLLFQSLCELQYFSTLKSILNVSGVWFFTTVLFFFAFSILRQIFA